MTEKLEITYESIGELYDDLKNREQKYVLATLTNKAIVTATPMEGENVYTSKAIVFEILCDGTLEQRDIEEMEKQVIKRLAKYVEPEKLLMEILKSLSPEQMIELHERTIEKEGNITSGSGCYSLKIGRKRGAPFELYLGGGVE